MYHFHRSAAIIIAARAAGEADRRYKLFTREFGLVVASARSVRAHASKLRYALQLYAEAEAVLVRGKGGWRITNAVPRRSFLAGADAPRRRAIAVLFALLSRMLPEEEAMPALFDDIARNAPVIADSSRTDEEASDALDVLSLRALSALGYVGDAPDLSSFTRLGPCESALLSSVRARRADIADAVNRALVESHL